MNRFFLLYLLIFATLICSCNTEFSKQEDDAVTSGLTISPTLSNMRITSIVEDKDGYVWIGTSRGLNRYNGDDMHQYFCNDQPNDIPDNRINDVFCDSKGQIWITTKNGIEISEVQLPEKVI